MAVSAQYASALRELSALGARLATAEGYLLGLTDDAAWANHKDCICGDCELLRDIRAFLAKEDQDG